MKTTLLKHIRQKVANKYQIVHTKENDGSYKYRIQCGPKSYLAYNVYDNIKDVEYSLHELWLEEAAKYLWDHRYQRNNKRKHYIW